MSISIRANIVGKKLSDVVNNYRIQVTTDHLDELLREEIGLIRDDIITGWPVDTYASRGAWQGPIKIVGGYRLQNDYSYAAVIEYGGYPGVGPKTIAVGATTLQGGIDINKGIYPSQRPAAPVRQALSKAKLRIAQSMAPKLLRQSGFRGLAGGGTSTAFVGGR